jgi:hypothetical protein
LGYEIDEFNEEGLQVRNDEPLRKYDFTKEVRLALFDLFIGNVLFCGREPPFSWSARSFVTFKESEVEMAQIG